jgi:hypothetical protein
MPDRRHPQVVNVDEVEPMGRHKGRFGATARRLGGRYAMVSFQIRVTAARVSTNSVAATTGSRLSSDK